MLAAAHQYAQQYAQQLSELFAPSMLDAIDEFWSYYRLDKNDSHELRIEISDYEDEVVVCPDELVYVSYADRYKIIYELAMSMESPHKIVEIDIYYKKSFAELVFDRETRQTSIDFFTNNEIPGSYIPM